MSLPWNWEKSWHHLSEVGIQEAVHSVMTIDTVTSWQMAAKIKERFQRQHREVPKSWLPTVASSLLFPEGDHLTFVETTKFKWPFSGRESMMLRGLYAKVFQELQTMRQQRTGKRSCSVLICGNPGIGKTSLLDVMLADRLNRHAEVPVVTVVAQHLALHE